MLAKVRIPKLHTTYPKMLVGFLPNSRGGCNDLPYCQGMLYFGMWMHISGIQCQVFCGSLCNFYVVSIMVSKFVLATMKQSSNGCGYNISSVSCNKIQSRDGDADFNQILLYENIVELIQ